jgi:hypothetical protein
MKRQPPVSAPKRAAAFVLEPSTMSGRLTLAVIRGAMHDAAQASRVDLGLSDAPITSGLLLRGFFW